MYRPLQSTRSGWRSASQRLGATLHHPPSGHSCTPCNRSGMQQRPNGQEEGLTWASLPGLMAEVHARPMGQGVSGPNGEAV
eukprot:7223029-Alexandrium_andersonii.AAC.1